MRRTFPITLLCCVGLAGCVPPFVPIDPIVYRVRMRAEIPEVEKRVVSLQLITPAAAGTDHVISYGVFTAALLDGTEDTHEDFFAGYASPSELKKGRIKLIVREAGSARVLHLPPRPLPSPFELYAVVGVPRDIENAAIRWDEAPRRRPPRRADGT